MIKWKGTTRAKSSVFQHLHVFIIVFFIVQQFLNLGMKFCESSLLLCVREID